MSLFDKLKKPFAKPPPERKQRAPRVRLNPTMAIYSPHGEDVLIENLSISGFGVRTSTFKTIPQKDQILEGVLKFDSAQFNIRVRVVQVSDRMVGCMILDPPENYAGFVNEQFKLELSALTARAIDNSVLQAEHDGVPHWFLGDQNAVELYFVEKDGHVQRFNGTIWGRYFESNAQGHLRFGVINEAPTNGRYPKAKTVDFQVTATPDMYATAVRFLENVPNLEANYRQQMLERIKPA